MSSGSPKSATDILSRVAIYSLPTGDIHTSNATSLLSPEGASMLIMQHENGQTARYRETTGCNASLTDPSGNLHSFTYFKGRELMVKPGCYFSFPNFDNWNVTKRDEEKDSYD